MQRKSQARASGFELINFDIDLPNIVYFPFAGFLKTNQMASIPSPLKTLCHITTQCIARLILSFSIEYTTFMKNSFPNSSTFLSKGIFLQIISRT